METGDGPLSPLSESLKGVDFMKKLLSLLIVMILCSTMLISCNDKSDSYECLGEFEHKVYSHYSIDDFPEFKGYGHCYDIATTYEEFANIVEDTNSVSEDDFEEYFIFVSTKYDWNTYTYASQEYKNFRVENGIVYLDRYVTYNKWVGAGSSIETYCFLIPKKLLDKKELNITGFEITEYIK